MADAGVEGLAVELDALRLELGTRRGHVVDVQREVRGRLRRELDPERRRLVDPEARLPTQNSAWPVASGRSPSVLDVERARALPVRRRDGDEVDVLDPLGAQPTEPSICSWISRFISTAYSSGSSFVIGSTKPETIIALASASESPRLIR